MGPSAGSVAACITAPIADDRRGHLSKSPSTHSTVWTIASATDLPSKSWLRRQLPEPKVEGFSAFYSLGLTTPALSIVFVGRDSGCRGKTSRKRTEQIGE
jgi:hypothetical protein